MVTSAIVTPPGVAAALAVLVLMVTSTTSSARSADTPAVSPKIALARLMSGNQRFEEGTTRHPGQDPARRVALAASQSPFAVILACSDSRVTPEIVFDQGLGDLFVIRVAGNTLTRAGLESIDYAVEHLGSSLIVVMGHDSCGAVTGAVRECPRADEKSAAGLPEIFSNICPAVKRARKASGDVVSDAIDLNVADQVAALKRAPRFAQRVKDGRLMIVGARYELHTGRVRILPAND
ncbi:MAG TPA: carbonic anhydrase [Candidatus Binataceae bacterium]|jgi:carbonic anhydrase|nr:carbonic anhydrase [Candidatus Binataceae bacterium]